MIDYQQLIFHLQNYWAKQGCTLIQPLDMRVGAGTFHPATFLAALGPEYQKVAYIQPSRRPTDGRYGDNPNRLQHYYQYQVLLKPSPVNIVELFFASLTSLGIDPKINDLRLVEDNWESPTLGAWGLGWEVWLNGMEVAQFTYFQQVGGFDCKPVSGELTYGLERIAMQLQQKKNVHQLLWSHESQLSYGDMHKQNEYEQSVYNFEQANIAFLFDYFNHCCVECARLCKKQLPLPAYEYGLEASHTFNLLDARQAISVSERQQYLLKIRRLTATVARAYLKNRRAVGFPLASAQARIQALEDYADL